MIYKYKKTNIIPKELTLLFNYYHKEIFNFHNLKVQDSSSDYIVESIRKNRIPEKNFTELLFHYIDSSNYTDVQIYKKAFIDKRLFSKIRSNNNYHPSFGTVTLLALALELSTAQFEELLQSASYSLPQNNYINITLKYCFDNKIYDIYKVNELIFEVSNKEIKQL